MPRVLPVLLLMLLLAACGGGDGDEGERTEGRTTPAAAGREEDREPDATEFRREANALCDRYNLNLVRRTTLPTSRKQERRVLRRVFLGRLRLLARLAHVEGPRAERRTLRRAIRAQRRAMRRGGPQKGFRLRGLSAFQGAGVIRCGLFGAIGLPGAQDWQDTLTTKCTARVKRIRKAVRQTRAAPVGTAKVPGVEALARHFRRAGRPLALPGLPDPARPLYRTGLLQLRRTGAAFDRLAEAGRNQDSAAIDSASDALTRAAVRGNAAWNLLNVGACRGYYDALSKGIA